MNEEYFKELYNLSLRAKKKGEVPVSALIVHNGKVISKAYNTRLSDSNPLNHAEIKCIVKASKKLEDWRLDSCDLYCTLEPCDMCKAIINECRINNIYYLASSNKVVNHKSNYCKIDGELSTNYSKLLTDFFRKLR